MQVARDGYAMDCFAGERMHKNVKMCAQQICNTSAYEVSLTKRVLSYHMAMLEDANLFVDRLINPQAAGDPRCPTCVAKSFTFEGTLYSAGDVVMIGEIAWFLEGGAGIDG